MFNTCVCNICLAFQLEKQVRKKGTHFFDRSYARYRNVFQTQHVHLNSKNIDLKQLRATSVSRMHAGHGHPRHIRGRRKFGLKIVHYFVSGIFQHFEGPQNVVTSTPRPSAPPFPQDVFHGFLCGVAVADDQPHTGHGGTSVAAPEAVKQHNKGFVGPQSEFVPPKVFAYKQPHGNTLLNILISLLVSASHQIVHRTLYMTHRPLCEVLRPI